jgi:hypothetical protein
MHQPDPTTCPAWCVADHAAEDEGGRRRHRGATVTLTGIALRVAPPHDVHGVELLIELHADDGDPLVAVYIGDGVEGLDLTTETAARLVRRLIETLQTAGAAAV